MSFRFWCFVAGLMSAFIAVAHVFGGGPEFHQPLLDSAMIESVKALFSAVWHEVTALLVLNAVMLFWASLSIRKNTALLVLVFGLNLSFGVLFLFYGMVRLGTAFALLQWVFFGIVSILVLLALYRPDRGLGVTEIAAARELEQFLPGHDFADAYERVLSRDGTALEISERIFGRRIGWLDGLVSVRNAVVRPFGLAGTREDLPQHREFVSFFPVLQKSPNRLLLGMNDKHLDFRLVIDVDRSASQPRLIATTLVKTHNIWGRLYMFVVKPFHRIIVPAVLRRSCTDR